MTAEQVDGFDRTISIGERAFERIKTFRTSASPQSYEIWFTYADGNNPALISALEEKLSSGEIKDEDLNALYEQHLSPQKLADQVSQMGRQLAGEADEMLTMVQTNLDRSERFSTVLNGAASTLEGGGSNPADLSMMVKQLVIATRTMERSTKDLEARLADTGKQIGELQTKLAAAQAEAFTDALTTLKNRKAFDTELGALLASAQSSGSSFSLLMIDIDRFKLFNDTHGHQTGDQVLKLVAQALKLGVRGRDLAARYGGEEFAVLLPGTETSGATIVAEALRQAVMGRQLIKKSTNESLGKITVSIGVTSYVFGDSAQTMIERADRCLYDAKDRGRNCVCSSE